MPSSFTDSDRTESLRSGESTRTSIGSNRSSARSLRSTAPQLITDERSTKSGKQLERNGSRLGIRNIFVGGKLDQNASSSSHKQKSFSSFFLTEEPTRAALNAIRMEANIKPAPRTAANQLPMPPKTPPRCTSPTWDPPPLVQAYDQSLKHAKLASSNLSSNSILRLNHSEGKNHLLEGSTGTAEGRNLHRLQISEAIARAEWTQKIYVLITSGYLLQYSGDGPNDRLPERTLQLGRQSAAFASDAIPGRHFVIQVSQAMDANGTFASSSPSLISRLGVKGADQRRATTNLLLVFNNSEDMESWLSTIRRKIESLGGKKHLSETGDPKFDEKIRLREKPSKKVIVKKDLNGSLANLRSPANTTENVPWTRKFRYQNQLGESHGSQTLSLRTSTDETGGATSSYNNLGRDSLISSSDRHSNVSSNPASSVSYDGLQLDYLRDSIQSYSQLSSGQRTVLTSPGSSIPSSPMTDKFMSDDVFRISSAFDEMNRTQNVSGTTNRDISTPASSDTVRAAPTGLRASQAQAPSSFTDPNCSVTSPSPSSSAFSASSSINQQNPASKTILDTLSPPTSPESLPGKWNKFKRKGPPAPLLARSLSPVDDAPSLPKQRNKSLTDAVKKPITPENLLTDELAMYAEVPGSYRIASHNSNQEQEVPKQTENCLTPMQSRPRPRFPGFDEQPTIVSKVPSPPLTPRKLSLSPPTSTPSQTLPPLSHDVKRRQPKARRSLPQLVPAPPPGPPPAPPPECALPPLPTPKVKSKIGGKKTKSKEEGGKMERENGYLTPGVGADKENGERRTENISEGTFRCERGVGSLH